jgi:hypothetical protein
MSLQVAMSALAWVPHMAFRVVWPCPLGKPDGELGVRCAGPVAMVGPRMRT